jgi:alkylhydroperoxidase family enzyme
MTLRVDAPDNPAGQFNVLARLGTPAVAEHNAVPVWAELYKRTGLSTREREAFRHRMVHIAGSLYGASMRSAALMVSDTDDPIPDEFYDNIFNSGWSGYSERERLIIEVVERFVEDHEALRDDAEFWARMHAQFTEDEIVDLCYHMVGPQSGRVLMAKVLLGYSEIHEVVPPSADITKMRNAQLELARQPPAS